MPIAATRNKTPTATITTCFTGTSFKICENMISDLHPRREQAATGDGQSHRIVETPQFEERVDITSPAEGFILQSVSTITNKLPLAIAADSCRALRQSGCAIGLTISCAGYLFLGHYPNRLSRQLFSRCICRLQLSVCVYFFAACSMDVLLKIYRRHRQLELDFEGDEAPIEPERKGTV